MKDKMQAKEDPRKRCKESFKTIDKFGQSVGLTWNGEDEYKTTFGASVSTILIVILMAYSAYRLFYLANRYNPTVSRTTLIRPPEEDEPFRP
jgi:lipopolysaccharide export LptBFGC system permease protein LptF